MKTFDDNSIDAIVTDPPYGIAFMSKDWDKNLPAVQIWQEALRVLKPGGHMLVACGTRTYHRMTSNIEDAGFEIREIIAWVYGSGFPKNHDIGKAIDNMKGAKQNVVGYRNQHLDGSKRKTTSPPQFTALKGKKRNLNKTINGNIPITAPATPEAQKWEGWGTALKPAMELFTLARKPIAEATVAKNVLEHGTGAINIDTCRIETDDDMKSCPPRSGTGVVGNWKNWQGPEYNPNDKGRWPANLIHDGSPEVVELFPIVDSGELKETHKINRKLDSEGNYQSPHGIYGKYKAVNRSHKASSGSAARFFYCAKAHPNERNEGLEGFEDKQYSHDGRNKEIENAFQRNKSIAKNHHPTVKPIALMQYLIKLITPPQGIVLDPFCGSGSTCLAAQRLGYKHIGIELDSEYHKIAVARCKNDMPLFKQV
jgi:site-specific DNA-methyltransferase (adenine-specific)